MNKIDKNLFWKPKEKVGLPWSYSKETAAKIQEDKETILSVERVPVAYDTSQTIDVSKPRPRVNRPLQQVNGRRVMRTTAKVIN